MDPLAQRLRPSSDAPSAGRGPTKATSSPLHGESRADSTWSSTNLAEAMPGVMTPLSWSIWGPSADGTVRRVFGELGLLRGAELEVPEELTERAISAFYGRPAFRLEFWCEVGDRLPGTTGAAVAEQIAAHVPANWTSRPQRRYYLPAVVGMMRGLIETPRALRRERPAVEEWYVRSLASLSERSEAEVLALLHEANLSFRESSYRATKVLFGCVQLAYDLLSRVAARTSISADSLVSGFGKHEETAMVADLWECSRGRMDLTTFISRHGHHGPLEGELSARVWREDPGPVTELIKRYGSRDEDEAPMSQQARLATERSRREQAFLAELDPIHRLWGRAVLRLARLFVPMRGVAKVMFLQSLDVARAAAREIGSRWAARGILENADDIFFLTIGEIGPEPPPDVRLLIAERQRQRAEFEKVELPSHFTGMPVPMVPDAAETDEVSGVGVSPGVVTATARVVDDPATCDFADGEILVAHTTDPSWASVMFLAGGLVVDIGGALSHAAVVSRELGIPCVMNTGVGTKVIRNGDLCRIDGGSGSVTVLQRAASA